MLVLQLSETPDWLASMFTSEVGLLVLLGISILEGTMMLRFMPSELVVPSALLLIGSSIPEVVTIVTIAVIGTTIGQTILFVLARRGGREYLLQKGWIPVSESRLDRVSSGSTPIANPSSGIRSALMYFPSDPLAARNRARAR